MGVANADTVVAAPPASMQHTHRHCTVYVHMQLRTMPSCPPTLQVVECPLLWPGKRQEPVRRLVKGNYGGSAFPARQPVHSTWSSQPLKPHAVDGNLTGLPPAAPNLHRCSISNIQWWLNPFGADGGNEYNLMPMPVSGLWWLAWVQAGAASSRDAEQGRQEWLAWCG